MGQRIGNTFIQSQKRKPIIKDNIIKIPLSSGKFAIVDKIDYPKIKHFNWSFCIGYASFQSGYRVIYLHRLILNAGKNDEVDHINGNKLDNTRKNLRIVNRQQNRWNSKKMEAKCTSKYKGVCFHKHLNKWQASIKKDYKRIHLGTFTVEKEAAMAYNKAALLHFGQYARLNNI